jgi:hypothetical protein
MNCDSIMVIQFNLIKFYLTIISGKVEAVVRGKDGGRTTIYRVTYQDGTTEELDLYKDYVDGSLKFL